MKYQPGDIIQCWGGFALVKAVHEDYLEVNYSAADKPADFRVSLNWIDGHWRPAETYDRTELLRLLEQARNTIRTLLQNTEVLELSRNSLDAIDHCLMRHAEAKHSGPTDTEILDWLVANDYDGDGIREEVTRAIKAERGKAK